MHKGRQHRITAIFIVLLCLLYPFSAMAAARRLRVLVVMSYEQEYPWVQAIRNGIDQALSSCCDTRYFYLDTKKNLAAGKQKAEEAYALFLQWRPDGVIAADDNAQSMFVLPYLYDKVKTPVMFCGVNAEPEQYGYPGTNVSGILERLHIRESIAFARQLAPIQSVCFIIKESPVAALVSNQINKEKAGYMVPSRGIYRPETFAEAISMAEQLRDRCDLLFIETLEGIPDGDGQPLTSKDIIPAIVQTFNKPTTGTDKYSVDFGVLCSVIKSGTEQGETAATMLLQAMTGTPLQDIPITRNFRGKRLLNVTTMKALGIKPRPMVLRGTQLVKTEE